MDQIDNLQININKQIEKIPVEKPQAQLPIALDLETEKKSEKQVYSKPEELLEPIKNFFSNNQTNVKFGASGSGDTQSITFKVVDAKTGEIIKEFPEEDLDKIYKSTKSANGLGLLIDHEV